MRLTQPYRYILGYGLALGVLLVLLKWLEAHYVMRDHSLAVFAGGIALVFTSLGIWLALRLSKPKVETLVVEKEVPVLQVPTDAPLTKPLEPSNLSRRELEVLDLMAKGLSNEEIAGQLFVSLNTIKTHSSSIYLKLDVKRRTQAIEKAKRLNIIH